jgi:hypothetical protein
MASTTTKTVSIRLRNEVAEYFSDKNLKEIVEGLYEDRNKSVIEDIWGGGAYDETLEEMANKLGKSSDWLVSIMQQLIEHDYFYMDDNGKMMIRNLQLPDDGLSVDFHIDLLKVSARAKSDIKRKMIKDIPNYNLNDEEYYLGNGAGQ